MPEYLRGFLPRLRITVVIGTYFFFFLQSLVFRVMGHPNIPGFEQCVSFDAFSNQNHELAYNVFCLCAMYFLPLMVISVCYLCIFYEISKNSKENSGEIFKNTFIGGTILAMRKIELLQSQKYIGTLMCKRNVIIYESYHFYCFYNQFTICDLYYIILANQEIFLSLRTNTHTQV